MLEIDGNRPLALSVCINVSGISPLSTIRVNDGVLAGNALDIDREREGVVNVSGSTSNLLGYLKGAVIRGSVAFSTFSLLRIATL